MSIVSTYILHIKNMVTTKMYGIGSFVEKLIVKHYF